MARDADFRAVRVVEGAEAPGGAAGARLRAPRHHRALHGHAGPGALPARGKRGGADFWPMFS